MKDDVRIYEDELYPYYDFAPASDVHEVEVRVQDRTLARWKDTLKAFRRVQNEMGAARRKADGR